MKCVELKDIKNFKGIRRGETKVDTSKLPQRGKKGQINRQQTAKDVADGTHYSIPTTIYVNVGASSVVCCRLKPRITDMIITSDSSNSSDYTCIMEEPILGAFRVKFEKIRTGNFNKVIEKEVERYIEQVEEIRKENELEMKNKNEEIDVLNYRLNKERDMKLEIQTKYADLWNENENTNLSNEKTGECPTEELIKYKELLDTGIITQKEFDRKKKQLLGL